MTRLAKTQFARLFAQCHPLLAACVLGLACTSAQAGDAGRGEPLFQKCQSCHGFDRGSKALGPSLAGLFGRRAGSLETFRYSPAMRRSDIVWEDASLDRFLAEPQATVRGNRMPFAGLSDKGERDDLIAYLHKAAAP